MKPKTSSITGQGDLGTGQTRKLFTDTRVKKALKNEIDLLLLEFLSNEIDSLTLKLQ